MIEKMKDAMIQIMDKFLNEFLITFFVAVALAILGYIYRSHISRLIKSLLYKLPFVFGFDKCGIKRIESSQHFLQEDIINEFKKARNIKVLVVRGMAVMGLKDSLFNSLIADKSNTNANIRILMLAPDSEYAEYRANEINEGKDAMMKGIRFSINEIIEAKTNYKVNLNVKLYNELPIWRLMFMDDVVFVSSYLPKKDGAKTPIYKITKNEHSLFEPFDRYFEYLWNEKSRPLKEYEYKNHRGFTFESALELLTDSGCKKNIIWHCKIVSRIAKEIAENVKKDHPGIDVELVELGALLHEIGKSQVQDINHAYIGGQIIRLASDTIKDKTLREKLARIVEVHTGVGLTKEEIKRFNEERGLNIPIADYVPETLEEKIVAYADKLVEGERDKTFEQQLSEKKIKFGADSNIIKKLESWHDEFKKYIAE